MKPQKLIALLCVLAALLGAALLKKGWQEREEKKIAAANELELRPPKPASPTAVEVASQPQPVPTPPVSAAVEKSAEEPAGTVPAAPPEKNKTSFVKSKRS